MSTRRITDRRDDDPAGEEPAYRATFTLVCRSARLLAADSTKPIALRDGVMASASASQEPAPAMQGMLINVALAGKDRAKVLAKMLRMIKEAAEENQ